MYGCIYLGSGWWICSGNCWFFGVWSSIPSEAFQKECKTSQKRRQLVDTFVCQPVAFNVDPYINIIDTKKTAGQLQLIESRRARNLGKPCMHTWLIYGSCLVMVPTVHLKKLTIHLTLSDCQASNRPLSWRCSRLHLSDRLGWTPTWVLWTPAQVYPNTRRSEI